MQLSRSAFSQIIGTIKSQGQLDGKFKASTTDTSLKCHEFLKVAPGAKTLISVQSRAAGQTRSGRRCRRRRARALRTTAAAASAGVDFAPAASMITAPVPDLAAEHPVSPCGVAEDQRHQHADAEQHEDLAVLGRGGLPDRDA